MLLLLVCIRAHWPQFMLMPCCPHSFLPAQLCWLTLVGPHLCSSLFVCCPVCLHSFIPTRLCWLILIGPRSCSSTLIRTHYCLSSGFLSYNTLTSADASPHPSNYTTLGCSLTQALELVSPSLSKVDGELGGSSLDGKPSMANRTSAGPKLLALSVLSATSVTLAQLAGTLPYTETTNECQGMVEWSKPQLCCQQSLQMTPFLHRHRGPTPFLLYCLCAQ